MEAVGSDTQKCSMRKGEAKYSHPNRTLAPTT